MIAFLFHRVYFVMGQDVLKVWRPGDVGENCINQDLLINLMHSLCSTRHVIWNLDK